MWVRVLHDKQTPTLCWIFCYIFSLLLLDAEFSFPPTNTPKICEAHSEKCENAFGVIGTARKKSGKDCSSKLRWCSEKNYKGYEKNAEYISVSSNVIFVPQWKTVCAVLSEKKWKRNENGRKRSKGRWNVWSEIFHFCCMDFHFSSSLFLCKFSDFHLITNLKLKLELKRNTYWIFKNFHLNMGNFPILHRFSFLPSIFIFFNAEFLLANRRTLTFNVPESVEFQFISFYVTCDLNFRDFSLEHPTKN